MREQIVDIRDRGGSIAADPVGEFYAWMSRGMVSVRDVSFGFPLAFALLIEIVSAFGPVTIAAYAEATRRDMSGHVRPGLDLARRDRSGPVTAAIAGGEMSEVLSWIAERALPTNDNRAVGVKELHGDYAGWSAKPPMTIDRFAREFDRVRDLPELAGKIRKFGERYYGIALTGSSPGA